nr:MAG TPA: hypothetical protein [Caudoviricetes sp.]
MGQFKSAGVRDNNPRAFSNSGQYLWGWKVKADGCFDVLTNKAGKASRKCPRGSPATCKLFLIFTRAKFKCKTM